MESSPAKFDPYNQLIRAVHAYIGWANETGEFSSASQALAMRYVTEWGHFRETGSSNAHSISEDRSDSDPLLIGFPANQIRTLLMELPDSSASYGYLEQEQKINFDGWVADELRVDESFLETSTLITRSGIRLLFAMRDAGATEQELGATCYALQVLCTRFPAWFLEAGH